MNNLPVEQAPPNPDYDEGYRKGWIAGFDAAKTSYPSQREARQQSYELGFSYGYRGGIEKCIYALQELKDE